MQILENISLKKLNTFGIDVKAKYFSAFSSVEELNDLVSRDTHVPMFILGGGSNILFTKDFEGIVAKNEIRGVSLIQEDDEHYWVKAGGGENWHQFVIKAIQNNWAGLENLSLIPGNVGASPMQNIGAYGVEIRDVFHQLNAFHIREKKIYTFGLSDCEFGYRESVFKGRYKNEFVILDVSLKLNKFPVFHTSYGAIQTELEKMHVDQLSIASISQAVINIRSSKLPDPAKIGNAGSFFKNPSVTKQKFAELKDKYPGIVAYENTDGTLKLAAGWLIEQCGWKGFRRSDAGCYENQALVLVNYGNAKGSEILNLSEEILASVQRKFDITLNREVNIV